MSPWRSCANNLGLFRKRSRAPTRGGGQCPGAAFLVKRRNSWWWKVAAGGRHSPMSGPWNDLGMFRKFSHHAARTHVTLAGASNRSLRDAIVTSAILTNPRLDPMIAKSERDVSAGCDTEEQFQCAWKTKCWNKEMYVTVTRDWQQKRLAGENRSSVTKTRSRTIAFVRAAEWLGFAKQTLKLCSQSSITDIQVQSKTRRKLAANTFSKANATLFGVGPKIACYSPDPQRWGLTPQNISWLQPCYSKTALKKYLLLLLRH